VGTVQLQPEELGALDQQADRGQTGQQVVDELEPELLLAPDDQALRLDVARGQSGQRGVGGSPYGFPDAHELRRPDRPAPGCAEELGQAGPQPARRVHVDIDEGR
jgi:hypothetical protein